MKLDSDGKPLIPIFVLTLVLIILAGWLRGPMSSLTASTAFAVAVISIGYRNNQGAWNARLVSNTDATPPVMLAQTTALISAVYAWSALSLLVIYPIIGVRWPYGLDLGLGFGAVAMLAARCAHYLRRCNPSVAPPVINFAVMVTAVHGIGVAGALAWLSSSGALRTASVDWAAQHIILAGGFAVACLCMFAVRTHVALTKP